MKTTIKKTAAWMLALLLALQMMPATAETSGGTIVISGTQGPISTEGYRDKLQITSSSSIIKTGNSVQLTATEGYQLKWSSSDESIATVDENGVVTGLAEGKVKITAEEPNKDGGYRDSLLLKIVGTPVQAESGEEGEDGETTEQTAEVSKTIVISINKKDKVVYDGQSHSFAFTAEGNFEGFDAGKVEITDESLLLTGKNCGVYQTALSEGSFTYDGQTEGYEFLVSDGWMRILPRAVEVKAEDRIRTFENPKEMTVPEAEITVTGLAEGDDPSTIQYQVTTETIGGIVYYVPEGETEQGNYKVTYVAGKIINDAPLYNIAEIDGKYYRLAKTRVRTPFDLKANYSKSIESNYEAEEYDFSDLTITDKNGNKYISRTARNAQAIAEGADYYTVKLVSVKSISNKIGAVGNWLIGEEERYNDPNNTDSYHRDFKITLVKNENAYTEQEIYNMLSLEGMATDYYRLRKTTILAPAIEKYAKNQILEPGEYVMNAYDFSNVVLTIDGETYRYSDHEPEGIYDSCFTVRLDNVVKTDRVNSTNAWYKNDAGWLDGAKEQYGSQSNWTPGFHANYAAKLYKGNRSERSIAVESSWQEGRTGYIGLKVTLTARLTGFKEGTYRLQWQHSTDSVTWVDQPGADGETFTYLLDETTTHYRWRVVAIDVK